MFLPLIVYFLFKWSLCNLIINGDFENITSLLFRRYFLVNDYYALIPINSSPWYDLNQNQV